MGMFDSFYVRKNGKSQEVQTKQLECLLDVYNLGSNVPCIARNIKSFVIVEDTYPEREWYGLIIYNNVFLDWVELESEDDDKADKLLEVYVGNPKLVVDRLLDILNLKNIELHKKNEKLFSVHRAVDDFIEFKKTGFNDEKKGMLNFLHKYVDYYKDGGTLEKLIRETILIDSE